MKHPTPLHRKSTLRCARQRHRDVLALLVLLCVTCGLSGCPGRVGPDWERELGKWPFDTGTSPALRQAQLEVGLRPDSPEAHVRLGEQYAVHGLPGLAMGEFHTALNYDRSYGRAYLGAAAIEVECGDLDRALALSRQAVIAMPGEPLVLIHLGQIRLRRRECTQAQEAFAQAIQRQPDNDAAWLGLITAYLEGGQAAEARECGEKALQQLGDLPAVRTNYGLALEALEEYEAAAEQYRIALRTARDIDIALPMNNLSYMYASLDENLDEALMLAEQATALRSRNASCIDTLGYVQYRLKRYEEAVGTLARAKALRPTSGTVRYHLGLALEALGKTQEATAEFLEALRLDPNTPGATDARRRAAMHSPAARGS
ncbi:MAG: tetratricopeptide repeat protein [Armatimonadota bacterium]